MFKQRVNEMLQGELDEHLEFHKHAPESRGSGNSRHGFSSKKIKRETLCDVVLSIPRNRNASFEPKLIPKHQRMSEQIEQSIIGKYSRGMTTRDIEDQVREMYGIDISESIVSTVTSRVLDIIKEWQSRPMKPVYFTYLMNAFQFKVLHNGKVVRNCIYHVIGLKNDGLKEILGM